MGIEPGIDRAEVLRQLGHSGGERPQDLAQRTYDRLHDYGILHVIHALAHVVQKAHRENPRLMDTPIGRLLLELRDQGLSIADLTPELVEREASAFADRCAGIVQ